MLGAPAMPLARRSRFSSTSSWAVDPEMKSSTCGGGAGGSASAGASIARQEISIRIAHKRRRFMDASTVVLIGYYFSVLALITPYPCLVSISRRCLPRLWASATRAFLGHDRRCRRRRGVWQGGRDCRCDHGVDPQIVGPRLVLIGHVVQPDTPDLCEGLCATESRPGGLLL